MKIKHVLSRRQAKKWAFRQGLNMARNWVGPNGDGSLGACSVDFICQSASDDCHHSWFIQKRHAKTVLAAWFKGWDIGEEDLAYERG